MKYWMCGFFILILGNLNSPSQAERKNSLPLLYQTYNFPVASRTGQPGFPDRTVGNIKVTTGNSGRYGEALFFPDGQSWIEYNAQGNFPLTLGTVEGTLSFWLSPDLESLPEGIQPELFEVDDGDPDDGAFIVDLSDTLPRRLQFTLTASFFLPENHPVEGGKKVEISSPEIRWTSEEWHHVALTWDRLNSNESNARIRMYIDSHKVAQHEKFEHPVIWQAKHHTIRIGQGYIGKIDDLALFDRSLSGREIREIYLHPEGVAGIYLQPKEGIRLNSGSKKF